MIGSGIYIDDVHEAFHKDVMVIGAMTLLILLALGGISYIVYRGVIGRVNDTITRTAQVMKTKDLTIGVPDEKECGACEIG